MGSTRGEIRGSSKIAVYLEYKELADDGPWQEGIPDPEKKKECKRRMEWDPNTEEWVLSYYLRT